MRNTRVLVLHPNPHDATSFYRALGPFLELEKRYEIEVVRAPEDFNRYDWTLFKSVDILFIQRPCYQTHVRIIENARNYGIPVWVDFDDDLFTVPKDNPAYETFKNPHTRLFMQESISKASVVSVSTQQLLNKFKGFNARIMVIPNAWDDSITKKCQADHPARKRIVWRGTSTHIPDLLEVTHDIIQLSHEYPDWMWFFIGYDPGFITDYMKPGTYSPQGLLQLDAYLKMIHEIQADIHVVPLKDIDFNRAKSNISWLEATFAGATTLAPKFPEFTHPGVIQYIKEDGYTFKSQVKFLMKLKQEDHIRQREQSWRHITENFFLSKVNEKRIELIRKMVQRRDQ